MLASVGHTVLYTAFFCFTHAAAVPCGHCSDITSFDDDEQNIDNNFFLLFADIGIMPNFLNGLNDVDVLHIALGF